jgi:ATP-binding cassette subfamily F protein 3
MPRRGRSRRRSRHAARNKRISAIEEKMRKFHDLVSRIDKALAEPAVYIEDPSKAALLSSQRGELERMLVAAEDEWLSLASERDSARDGTQRATPKAQCKQKQQRQQNQRRENPNY